MVTTLNLNKSMDSAKRVVHCHGDGTTPCADRLLLYEICVKHLFHNSRRQRSPGLEARQHVFTSRIYFTTCQGVA
jgi:hypothetical protein